MTQVTEVSSLMFIHEICPLNLSLSRNFEKFMTISNDHSNDFIFFKCFIFILILIFIVLELIT